MENSNLWNGRENERLSKYDQSNEGREMPEENISLSNAENQYDSENSYQAASNEESDDERYNNTYGSGSDSSRSLLTRGNEMVFENDHEGQEFDDSWDAAKRDEREESYEDERRRLEAERKYGGFDTRV